ncbi:MAG TPA: hypothetical protein VJY40_07100 [Corynebacterium sp.]|nr:hypothetical protein [Corynebacterium sp.]
MGSIGYTTPLNTRDAIHDYVVTQALMPEHQIVAYNIAATGQGRWSWSYVGYYAIRDGEGDVFCVTFLASKRNGEFVVKTVDETMGPGATDQIAEKVLKALPPTDSKWATDWRAGCWELIRKRKQAKKALRKLLETGGEVDLVRPLSYSGAGEVTRVWVGPDGSWYTTDRLHRLTPMPRPWEHLALVPDHTEA